MILEQSDVYGGISDVSVPLEPFDFGYGVTLAPTKAHLMRPCLMTFERPETSFPAWESAGGSFGFDLVAEVMVPANFDLPQWFDRANTIWWLAALLRLRATPRLRVPVISNASFSQTFGSPSRSFWPVESESERTRLLLEPTAGDSVTEEDLKWIRAHWIEGGRMMHKSRTQLGLSSV